jgi:hypothetical protein
LFVLIIGVETVVPFFFSTVTPKAVMRPSWNIVAVLGATGQQFIYCAI